MSCFCVQLFGKKYWSPHDILVAVVISALFWVITQRSVVIPRAQVLSASRRKPAILPSCCNVVRNSRRAVCWPVKLLRSTTLFKFRISPYKLTSMLAVQLAYRLARGWRVRGSNPSRARFFILVDTGCDTRPAPCAVCTLPLSENRAADAWRWPPTSCSAEVKNR
jgi:hypothetical protein